MLNSQEVQNGLNFTQNARKANDSSLTLTSQRWNDAVSSAALTPHSVLEPLGFSNEQSANGTAGQNFLPGFGTLGTGDGESANTFGSDVQLRYIGGDPN